MDWRCNQACDDKNKILWNFQGANWKEKAKTKYCNILRYYNRNFFTVENIIIDYEEHDY